MRDRDPVVLRRMLALRSFPIFGELDLNELATLAENVVEATFAHGATIAAVGQPVEGLDLIIAGEITSGARTWGPGQLFGALEVLAGVTAGHHAIAASATRVLRLRAVTVPDLVEDNFGLLRIALRGVAAAVGMSRPSPFEHASTASGARPLDLTDRLVALRREPVYAAAPLDALVKLAQASDEVVWSAGAEIVRAGQRATVAHVVLSGVSVSASGTPGPSSFGLIEVLAGGHHTSTVAAASLVRTLATSAGALFDVLEDHTDLGLEILRALARILVES